MTINDPVEITYMMLAFTFLGGILLGALLRTCHVQRHPTLIGGILGALFGLAVLEGLPFLL